MVRLFAEQGLVFGSDRGFLLLSQGIVGRFRRLDALAAGIAIVDFADIRDEGLKRVGGRLIRL